MNLLLQLYTPSKCQIYNNWTVHEHKCLSSFLFFRFFFKLREREREREWYIKFGIRRNSPKVTYLIFRRGSTRESFFFYGLIDFRLFLTLAWRKWLLRVSQIFFRLLHPEYLAIGSVFYEPCQTTDFFSFVFPLTGGSPHFRFRVPANRLASTFLPPWSGDFVRATRCHPSQVTEYRQVAPIYHHALTVILWGLATVNSNERIAVIPLPSSQWDITWQTATAANGIYSTKAWLSRLVNFKNAIWTWGHFRRMICNKTYLMILVY